MLLSNRSKYIHGNKVKFPIPSPIPSAPSFPISFSYRYNFRYVNKVKFPIPSPIPSAPASPMLLTRRSKNR